MNNLKKNSKNSKKWVADTEHIFKTVTIILTEWTYLLRILKNMDLIETKKKSMNLIEIFEQKRRPMEYFNLKINIIGNWKRRNFFRIYLFSKSQHKIAAF